MRISQDPDDYAYAPPPERTRRIGRALLIGGRVFVLVMATVLIVHLLT